MCVYTGQYLYITETLAEIFPCIKLLHHTNTSGPCPSPPRTASSSSPYLLSERISIPLLLLLRQLSVRCALLWHLHKWAMLLSIRIKSSNSKKIWKWTTWRELTRERERESARERERERELT